MVIEEATKVQLILNQMDLTFSFGAVYLPVYFELARPLSYHQTYLYFIVEVVELYLAFMVMCSKGLQSLFKVEIKQDYS